MESIPSDVWVTTGHLLFNDDSYGTCRYLDGNGPLPKAKGFTYWCSKCRRSFKTPFTPKECSNGCTAGELSDRVMMSHKGYVAATFPFLIDQNRKFERRLDMGGRLTFRCPKCDVERNGPEQAMRTVQCCGILWVRGVEDKWQPLQIAEDVSTPQPVEPETDPVGGSLPNDYGGMPDSFCSTPEANACEARVCNDDCCPAGEAGEVISEGTGEVIL